MTERIKDEDRNPLIIERERRKQCDRRQLFAGNDADGSVFFWGLLCRSLFFFEISYDFSGKSELSEFRILGDETFREGSQKLPYLKKFSLMSK
jgi:hypothetical protein